MVGTSWLGRNSRVEPVGCVEAGWFEPVGWVEAGWLEPVGWVEAGRLELVV
jgi:hypothetical protein